MKKWIPFIAILLVMNCTTSAQKKKTKKKYTVSKTNTEWKKVLNDMQYYVLREAGTERAFSSPLNKNNEKGIYVCAACKQHCMMHFINLTLNLDGPHLIEPSKGVWNWM